MRRQIAKFFLWIAFKIDSEWIISVTNTSIIKPKKSKEIPHEYEDIIKKDLE